MSINQKIICMGAILLFCCASAVFAQNDMKDQPEKITVAVVPFHNEDEAVSAQFVDSLQKAVADMEKYSPFMVDMNNLPPDVPEGGFPQYVCPSPSMTGDVPYSLTGELFFDEGSSEYHLRLYLWQMADSSLVYSDELSAQDQAAADIALPALLDWLFSKIKQEVTVVVVEEPVSTLEEDWLYLGWRLGPSLKTYTSPDDNPYEEDSVRSFNNISAAFFASLHLLPFLDFQGEAVFTTDYAPFTLDSTSETVPVTSNSLMFPLLLKFTLRQGRFLASILGGIYYIVPLQETQFFGDSFKTSRNPPLGYTAGGNIGVKAGSGYIFLDVRWSQDLKETLNADDDPIYKRRMITFSIGYELGLFRKKQVDFY